ncbi:MAG TPA: membrane dipeptidase [Capillibacterium sp.]
MSMNFYPVLDGHADTLVRISEEGGSLWEDSPHLHLDLPRLKKAGVILQVLAVCAAGRPRPYDWAKGILEEWGREYARHQGELLWIRSAADFRTWAGGGKVGVLLALEGLEPLEGKPARLEEFYALGVRMIALTWNGANPFACGVGVPVDSGLTPEGRTAVRLAEELGLLLDLSHLGRESFKDVMAMVREPVCVSHANVDAVHPHRRNLTAEQIRLVAETGGTVGLTFYPPFIGEGEIRSEALLPHLEALLRIGGEACPALGSDFDGIDLTPADMNDVTGIPGFLQVLAAAGFSPEVIKKVAGGNFHRLLARKFGP